MKITDVQAHVLAIPMAPGKQKMPWTWGQFQPGDHFGAHRCGSDGIRRGLRVRCAAGHRLGRGRDSQAHAGWRRRHPDHRAAGPHVPPHAPVRALRRHQLRHQRRGHRPVGTWPAKAPACPSTGCSAGPRRLKSPPTPAWSAISLSEHVSEAVSQARDEGYDAIKLHQIDVSKACTWRARPPATTSC